MYRCLTWPQRVNDKAIFLILNLSQISWQYANFDFIKTCSIGCETLTTSLIVRFMGPTWFPSGVDRTQVGPVLAPWTLLSGISKHASASKILAVYYGLEIYTVSCLHRCCVFSLVPCKLQLITLLANFIFWQPIDSTEKWKTTQTVVPLLDSTKWLFTSRHLIMLISYKKMLSTYQSHTAQGQIEILCHTQLTKNVFL